jgi:hypothetical protein
MPILSLPLDAVPLPGQATVNVRVAVRPSRARQLARANQAVPPPAEIHALIDTGSAYTLLDAPILAALGLTTPTAQVAVVTATGATVSFPRFHVSLTLLHPMPRQNLWLQSAPVLSANLAPLGAQVLLGCDILARCVLVWDGPGGRFVLSY